MFRLAAMLGRTVGELESTLSSAELSEWLAFDGLYTLPDSYFVGGQVCSAVSGSFSGKPLPPENFVPFFRPSKPRPQSPAEIRAAVRARLAAAKSQARV